MTRQLSLEQVRSCRLQAQHLHPATAQSNADPAQLVRNLCSLQSQELPSAHLAIRARSHGLASDDIKHAREVGRSIVLTWCMRGTMHLITAEDLAWLLPFFGPIFIKKTARRFRQLGLDESTRTQAAQIMRDVLHSRGPLIRKELAGVLGAKGIPVEGQAIAHLVRAAALEGVICFGPEQDGELSYVALADWLPAHKQPQPDAEQFLAELTRRYLQAFAPANPDDFASWSGLSIIQARTGFKAISNEIIEVEIMGSSAWMFKQQLSRLDAPLDEHVARLLPRYDNYLLGYKSRNFMVSEAHAKQIHPGGGLIRQTVIMDGLAIATWHHKRKKKSSTISIEPFEPISSDLIPHLESEVRDIGRFLEQETQLQL